MKAWRILLRLLGLWMIINGVLGVLSYGTPWLMGISETTAADVIKGVYSLAAVCCGFGILWLCNWARWGLAALTFLKLASLAWPLIAARNMADAFGWCLIGAMLLVLLAVIYGLIRAGTLTKNPEAGRSRAWMIAGAVTLLVGIGLYALYLIDFDPIKMGDIATRSQGELGFLKKVTDWNLSKLLMVNSQAGNAVMWPKPEGILSVRPTGAEDEQFILKGIPALKAASLEVNLAKNALLLNGAVFVGAPFKTKRFLWQDLSVEGVTFKKEDGPLSGTISLARALDGERIYVILQLEVYGKTVEGFYVAEK